MSDTFGDSQKRKEQRLREYMKADGAAAIKGATSMDAKKKSAAKPVAAAAAAAAETKDAS